MQSCAFASPFIYIWLPYVGLQTTPRGSRMLPLHLWSYQQQDRIVMMLLRLRNKHFSPSKTASSFLKVSNLPVFEQQSSWV
ncbi:hypothetical protein PVAP13_3NG241350 [Panicum virgatum]|uniref:Uncharacterized protein n=1 Tax=Panicum virgatum TaxID=38727 RepID=A0A8T0UKW1_PANVG|nr:hypothetical protein PVAP13_3NG241350 [Panicum virgatum]